VDSSTGSGNPILDRNLETYQDSGSKLVLIRMPHQLSVQPERSALVYAGRDLGKSELSAMFMESAGLEEPRDGQLDTVVRLLAYLSKR
jgi:hypothetical protein